MVDFEETPTVTEQPSGKKTADFFASVRERGILNASLDTLSRQYDETHPGFKSRWELFRPGETGGTDMVSFREGQGFRAVRMKDLYPDRPEDSVVPETDTVRRGDLILLAAPTAVVNQMLLQDAQAANDDLRAPQLAFEEAVRKTTVKTSDGTSAGASPFGKIRREVEDVVKVGESQHELLTQT